MTAARLDREAVIAAALALCRRVGVDGLTMRGLAGELGVTTMAAYHYVGSKDDLMSLVADAGLGLVPLPDETLPWQDALRRSAADYRRVLDELPGVSSLVIRRRGLTPNARAHLTALLRILHGAGFGHEAPQVVATVMAFLLGRGNLRQRQGERKPRSSRTIETDDVLLHALAREGGTDATEAFGLEVIIAGLEGRLRMTPLARQRL